MSKSKKKWLLPLTLLLSASMLLSACGGNKEESAGNGGGTAEKPVELIWYTIGTPQKDVDKVEAEINKYTAEKIGVTVDMKMIDFGDYNQKMQVMAASGEPMDILFTSSWAFDYVQNARKGAFMELDELIESHGKGIKEAIDPAFLEGSKVDGHNYAIPANKELPAQEAWRFNKTLLDKYNLDISNVKSMESLEPLLKTIKENEPNVVPLAISKDFGPLLPFDYIIEKMPMAVYLDDKEELKVVNFLEMPETMDMLKLMNKYYKAGYISPEAATTTSTQDLMTSGNWFTDRAATQPFADNLWSQSYGYPVVSTPAGDANIFNWSVMGSMQAISANSKYPEKAMEFLNLLNTDVYLRNLVDSGIEGVHYKKLSENVMENLPESKNYDMPTFALGNVMLTYLNPEDPENKWEEFKKFNESGQPAPLLGFNFDPTKVSTELAAVNNVKEEFWAPLMTGTVNPEEFLPKANEKLKAAGLDKIIAEAQSQIDAWKASK
ncbi:ABC transporter substrate-binding protein [Paenibacillus lautus]|jgi:putative aldouronate transport system substrate-binding protein|uniref:ABC transporter substrate-binding protein n=1 Tax=Paenibacillus TaxID=44249 RepID=UPI00017898DF|nr:MULTISPECIES: ABC transporter substrate-binding protein [Paenibacillus]VTR62493.1 Lipoprotein lplA [Actinobacillus pleuropneumoniae]ACX64152.1 extracellular solute-binding protein family 1 [Paenibacillus sp. Y412MC10]ETT57271.1 family 1 extracellular solute-binding protein [Paenibacillus sp. FSL H8-457]MCI1772823.1 ABC transporter substrate-binding protein [Paenibacillus lautus]MCM3256473.1 ABC transporter substrate-binding protein [Paenibacillus lautus]